MEYTLFFLIFFIIIIINTVIKKEKIRIKREKGLFGKFEIPCLQAKDNSNIVTVWSFITFIKNYIMDDYHILIICSLKSYY